MRELKYTTERYETRYLKSWSVSVVSTIIWSIDNLLDQNLTLGLSRLITSRLRYSQSTCSAECGRTTCSFAFAAIFSV